VATRRKAQAKETTEDDHQDAVFLRTAQEQLKSVKGSDAQRMRPYLKQLQRPDVGEDHILSANEARSLLNSTATVDRPIFVSGAANSVNVIDPDDERRPIEQLFTWLNDPNETHELVTPGKSANPLLTTVTIRKRFEAHNGPLQNGRPYNFPAIVNPFPTSIAPNFTNTRQCQLLREVCRALPEGIEYSLKQAEGDYESYGGREAVEKVKEALKDLRK
jgi:hypothetical protein